MDNITKLRVSGHTIRRACEVLEQEVNHVMAPDIEVPVMRGTTVGKVRELHRQLGVWLSIADGETPHPSILHKLQHTEPDGWPNQEAMEEAWADQPAGPLAPLTQRTPTPPPTEETHK